MFECECQACKEKWPLEDEVPDELYRIPTFEQEKVYKVRHGDKKDIVKAIIELRREVEKSMSHKRFKEAIDNYQKLCEKLEDHIRRPHLFFLQTRSGITHCIWNLYCTPFPELPIEEDTTNGVDVNANRAAAKLIYSNNMTETSGDNNALELGPFEVVNDVEEASVDAENEALLETTRKLLQQSSNKVQEALLETQEQKSRIEQERLNNQEANNGLSSFSAPEENGYHEINDQKISSREIESQTQTNEEREELMKKREYEKEIREKEQLLRQEKRKQWEQEEK